MTRQCGPQSQRFDLDQLLDLGTKPAGWPRKTQIFSPSLRPRTPGATLNY